MKAYYKLMLVVLAMCSNKIFAQVGMTTNNPHKSAALDLKATKDQGILIPNVNLASTTDVSAIAGGVPAQSLLVYNTNAGITGTGASGTGYYYWDTNIWKKLSTATDITTGTASVTSPNATINVSGTNTVFGATTVDIKPGGNNTVMTTNGSGGVVWAPFTALGDNLGNHTATQRLNMSNFSVFGADTLIAKNAQLSNLQPGAATDSILTINPVTGDVRKIAPSSVASSVAWGLTGNTGTNPATNFLGTIDAKDMVVRTNNAERMRLTSAGSVGIGTATPKSKLSVSGGAISQDDFTDGDKFLLLGNTNAAKITHNLGWIFGNYAGANVDAAGNPVSTSSGVFTWNVSQTGAWAEIMRLTNTGSLGLGTNAPTAKLDIAGNARIRTLPVGILTDSVVTADINGNLRKIAIGSMGDNLGNHRATTTLHMANNTIDSIYAANILYALNIKDRNAGYTKDFILYKNNGTFGIYNNTNSRNELSIDSATGKTTLTSAAISKGTDGSVPAAGSIATSADVNGNIIWKPASSLGSASVSSPNATINITGTNTVLGATTVDIKPGANNTIMTTNGSGVVTWVPGNTMDTAMIAGSNINIVRNAGGNTISATDTAMVAGAGIGIIRNASGNTISVTGGTNSVTSPNATVNVTGTNTVLGATTIDIKPGGNNTVMTTNGAGVVTWVPNNTLDTALIAGSNINIIHNAGGNTISATDTAMVAGAGIGITRNASGNTISVTGGTASVTSPNATVSVTGTNTVLGATSIDIKPGGNNTVMTTDGTGNIIWKAPSAIGGTASVTSPNATVNVTGTNTVLGATTIDIKPGGNNTVMTTNGSGVVTWVPSNTIDTAMIAGTGIGITRSASGNTIAVTGGNSSVTSPNATINVSGTNTVLGATTIDIKAGGNNTVMTTNGSGSVTWAPVSSLGDNLGNHTATQRLNMNNFSVYGADTLIANKARLTALTTGAATDSILTVNTITGDVRRISPASFGDNLGNHRATTTLHMANNSIDSIYTASVYYQVNIYDRIAANTNYMSLYKNNGTFGIWNSKRATNEISIDETSGKTTLTSAAITKGTDGSVPAAGSIATSADASGNIVWKPVSSLGSASVTSPNATVNVTGTNTVLGATTIDIKPGGNNTIMTTNGSGVVTWVPSNTIDTAMIAGSNISIVRNAGGNTISATDTAMIAGTGIGITRSASGNTIAVTGGSASVTSPNATINVSGTNTVLGATTIDIKAGGNNTVMTTNGSGSVTWAPVSSLGDNLGNHTATQRLNMNSFSVYGADTLIANKARLTAVTPGAATDSVLKINTTTGDVRRVSAASFGDNLGNHTATQRLNMSSKSIFGADTLIARNAQLSNLQSGAVTDSIVTVNPATGDIRKVSTSAMVGTVNIKRVTANYTLTTTDNILIVNAPASSTITITVPTTPAGRTYTIKRVDDNVATVNIVFSGGAVVDETDTQISVGNRVSYQIAEEDATHWHTISRF